VDDICNVVWAKLGSVPPKVQSISTVLIAVCFGLASITDDGWATAWLVLALASSAITVILALAAESRREALEDELKRLKSTHSELNRKHLQCASEMETAARQASDIKDEEWAKYVDHLCYDRLNILLHAISECFTSTITSERSANIKSARTAIVHATADLVGNSDQGTRANIFKLTEDDEGEVMLPEKYWGRGRKSVREFRPNSETFKAAKRKESRFVSVADPDDSDEKLDYETYLTYPIEDGTGQLYGLLTVDCLKAGELAIEPDRGKMSVLAAMLGLTYQAEGLRITSIST